MPSVLLRPWHPSDVPEVVRLADDPAVADQMRDAFPHPYTAEAGRAWVAFAAGTIPPTHFAVECEGELVGGAGYLPGRDIERCGAEVGYWIGRPHWGKGSATAAVRALVGTITARGGFTRLFAVPFAANTASRQVLEKAGFTLDAVLERSAIKGGRVVDQALYSLLLPGEGHDG